MTAAWSSAVQVRSWSAANAIRTSSHQISESTMTPSRSKMTASLRSTIPSALRAAGRADPERPLRTGSELGPPTGRPSGTTLAAACRRRAYRRSGTRPARPPVDGRQHVQDELGDAIGGHVGPRRI